MTIFLAGENQRALIPQPSPLIEEIDMLTMLHSKHLQNRDRGISVVME